MIVLKFGGSSVDSAASIERVAGIVRSLLPRRPVVVVSAMAKTTRQLLKCADAAAAGDLDLPTAYTLYEELRGFHWREAHAAVPAGGHRVLDAVLERYFGELRQRIDELAVTGQLTPRIADVVASYGELLASAILALAIDGLGDVEAPWIDCRQVMITDDAFNRARPIYEETDARLRRALLPHVEAGRVPVLGGYVGATRDGATTTLGKEGSDFSAAIVGAALGAEEIQIWTDVDGMMTADPQVVPDARKVCTLSFCEALELACSGAKKPHYGTLGPASRAGVPIRVLSSRTSRLGETLQGTLIGRRDPDAPPVIKSITSRANAHRITVRGSGDGFQEAVFEACERFRPSLIVLGIGGMGDPSDQEVELALDKEERLFEIHSALGRIGELGLAPGRAVVTLVSEDLATSPELRERTLAAASERPGLEPRLVLAGVAAPCVRCLTSEDECPSVVASLHEKVFGSSSGEPVP
ncbi:MAG TPA: aspartate kinase [Thermoanaerobaculia bacterium]